MSMKEKQIFTSHFRPAMANCNNSWEETAFAKDMRAGILGGCTWPPRFYSCTFCQREFKSAQALGGHMNVHRRDRARSKQYPDIPCSKVNGNHVQLDCSKSLHTQLPEKVGSQNHEVLSTPDPSSGLSTTTLTDTLTSSNVKALSTMEHFMLSPTYPKPPGVKAGSEADGDCVETNLSVALNSSEKRSPAETTIDEAILLKRHKISSSSLPDFAMSSCSSAGRLSVQSADVILGSTPAGIEDLDLELRLGDPQRV